MASVVGIDFGNLASKIGVARQRGIDVITNEVSNRATPSLISFGPKNRAIGEAAKNLETSNFKNTVGSLKRIVGRSLSDSDIANVESRYINAKLVDASGSVGVQVNYLGEPHVFSATQLVAAYLGKLRDIANREVKQGVSDVVISVPGWYTEAQRRALHDAALIAGLNPLRLINDTTAIALGYGITKADLPPPETPRHVVFVDIGHSNYSVAVVAFSQGQFTVKATAYDRHLGGRDLDYALVQHFATEFKTKYKIDVLSSAKATFRLAAQTERLKKILSANAEAPLSVESIMNDIDASSKLTREQFEALPTVADVLSRITAPLAEVLQAANIGKEDVYAVELVGGCTRVPAIKDRIQAFFGKPLSTTLNQDEAVARGATFACAMLSPVFRVREFAMHDVTHYPVKVQWERSPDDPDEETELVVFDRGNAIPSTKILSFYRSSPFELEARYDDGAVLPGSVNPWIGKISVKGVNPAPDGSPVNVKIKVRVNQNCFSSFEGAYYVEESGETMEVDGETKRKVVKRELPFVATNTALDKSMLETWKEIEAANHSSDKLVADTEERKNALEEYVYDMRSKLEDRYAAYVQPEEKAKLIDALQHAEDWLYSEEGEDATKSEYISRYDGLFVIGGPVAARFQEAEARPRAQSELREIINQYHALATSSDEKYAHIEEKDRTLVIEKVATAQKWLDDLIAKQAERPKNTNPVITVEEIRNKKDEVGYYCAAIMNKPKPRPKVDAASGRGTPNPGAGTETPKPEGGKEQQQEMEVD